MIGEFSPYAFQPFPPLLLISTSLLGCNAGRTNAAMRMHTVEAKFVLAHTCWACLRSGLQAQIDLRLMVTSRFELEIMDKFREVLKLDLQASDEDVKQFVEGQIYLLSECTQLDPILKEWVVEKILELADGMCVLL
jgi:hypothetical protein